MYDAATRETSKIKSYRGSDDLTWVTITVTIQYLTAQLSARWDEKRRNIVRDPALIGISQ